MLRDLLRARRIFFFRFFVVEWFVNWLRVSGFTYERIKCKTTLLVCSILFAPSSIISRLPINIWTVVCFAVERLIASGNVYLFGSVWDFNGSTSTTNKHSIAQDKNRGKKTQVRHTMQSDLIQGAVDISPRAALVSSMAPPLAGANVCGFMICIIYSTEDSRARASRRPHCAEAFLAQLKSQINID